MVFRPKGIRGGAIGNDTTLPLDAPLELITDGAGVLFSNRTAHQHRGCKHTEKKSHAFHARIIKKCLSMAMLIPPQELLELYAQGWFPMAMEDGSIRCFSPDPRGIIPLETFHVPHGTRKTLRDPLWEVRVDTCFEKVMRTCGEREETWIDETLVQSYLALHRLGQAHSLEIWREGELAGGLYGVRMGAAFFGESMFHTVSGASKVALVRLVERLQAGGFRLLDTQWLTPHLVQFGAVEIPRRDYLKKLREALGEDARFD